MRTIVLTALAAIAALLVAPAATADASVDDPAPITWQVQPAPADGDTRADISMSLDPGAQQVDAIQVSNLGDQELTLDLSALDMILTSSGEPSLPVDPPDEPLAAGWVSVREDQITLGPGESAEVPFVVAVPERAEPGDYGIAVIASTSRPTTTDTGQQVLIDARVGARLYLRVLGDLRSEITVSEISLERAAPWWNPLPADARVDFVVENTGNVRLDGTATVTVQGPLGWGMGEPGARTLPQLLPGDRLRLSDLPDDDTGEPSPLRVASVAAAGVLTTTVRIDAEETSTGQAFVYETAADQREVPWSVVVVLALAAAVIVWRLLRRRSRRRRASREARQVADGAPSPASTSSAPADSR